MLFSGSQFPEIISLHIPKTAGTSFRNILKNVYGDDQVVRFDINEKGIVRINESLYNKTSLPNVKVIHGHFVYNDLIQFFDLPQKHKLITWVRDPVTRVVSNFYYLESRLKELLDEENNNLNIIHKLQKTLIEYSRSEINRNRQAKFLTGIPLEKFDFIGIHEHFNTEVNRLSKILNWNKEPEILFHNKTPENRPEISAEILDEIYTLNLDDVKLYDEAIKIRNKSIS